MNARAPLLLIAAAFAAAACEREGRPTGERPLPRPGAAASVVSSELMAGLARAPARLRNPYAGNPHMVAEGKRLYTWFNCAGCHGINGGGGIGPPFSDSDWIYGSAPANIHQSIVQGRPNGMPAFNRLTDDQVWKLVSYVETLDPSLDRGSNDGGAEGAGADDAGAETP